MSRGAWVSLAVVAAIGAALLLVDAVRDLLTVPSVSAVLRVVVEAIAAAVLVGWIAGRARRTPQE